MSQMYFNRVFAELCTSTTIITIWQRNMVASCCHPQPGCHRMSRRLISTVKALCLNTGELRAIAPPQQHDSTTTKPLRTTRTRMRSNPRGIRRTPLWRVSDVTVICSRGSYIAHECVLNCAAACVCQGYTKILCENEL